MDEPRHPEDLPASVEPEPRFPHDDQPPNPRGPAPGPPVTGPDSFPSEGPNSLAGIGQRALARIIDGLLFAVPSVLLVISYVETEPGTDEVRLDMPDIVPFLILGLSALYEVGMVAWRGQTLGKMAMKIRIARGVDGAVPSAGQAAIRYLLPTVVAAIPLPFLSLLALLIYLSASWDAVRQGWHDKAAGTVVVRTA